MASVLRIIKHDTLDDKRGHHYDVYWVRQGVISGTNHNEIPTDTTKVLPRVHSAAALTDGTLTTPTVTLFYGGHQVRLTGGTAGDEVAVIMRRDTGSPQGSTQVPLRFR